MNKEIEEFLVNLHKNKEPDEWIQIEIKTLHEMIEKGKQQERERIIGEIEKLRDNTIQDYPRAYFQEGYNRAIDIIKTLNQ